MITITTTNLAGLPDAKPVPPRIDLDMPFRPSMDALAYYVATGDWVMLFNAVTLAVTPIYSE